MSSFGADPGVAKADRPSLPRWLEPLLPALLLGQATLLTGNFSGAATSSGAALGQLAILAFCLLGIQQWSDPLRLGRVGRWIVPLTLALIAWSWWLSPVSRAGRTALILLPAFVLMPAAVARCWQGEARNRIGRIGVSAVVLAIAGLALWGRFGGHHPRASFPLGHHTLLAGWLTLLLPLALLHRERRGFARWLALAAGAVGLIALAATGSSLGYAVVLTQAGLAIWWLGSSKRWLAIPLLALGWVLVPRLLSIAEGLDSSMQARIGYLQAGFRGLAESPFAGWGPGSTPWTIAQFMRPEAELNPSTEIIGDLHSMPVQLAYEVGLAAAILVLVVTLWFVGRRWHDLDRPAVGLRGRAGLIGLVGGLIFSFGAAPVAVPALSVAAGLVLGACLSQTPEDRQKGKFAARLAVGAYLAWAITLLLPSMAAHRLYDRARIERDPALALAQIRAAVELDPDFPLYRARAAWLAADLTTREADAAEALRAAELATGLAPLWLEAGFLGAQVGAPWAVGALERAALLDPLSTLTAFHLMTVQPDSSRAVDAGARALRGEPGFAQALFWRKRKALALAVAGEAGIRPHITPIPESSRIAPIAMMIDRDSARSFSLYAFRRSPWPGALAPVELVLPPDSEP